MTDGLLVAPMAPFDRAVAGFLARYGGHSERFSP